MVVVFELREQRGSLDQHDDGLVSLLQEQRRGVEEGGGRLDIVQGPYTMEPSVERGQATSSKQLRSAPQKDVVNLAEEGGRRLPQPPREEPGGRIVAGLLLVRRHVVGGIGATRRKDLSPLLGDLVLRHLPDRGFHEIGGEEADLRRGRIGREHCEIRHIFEIKNFFASRHFSTLGRLLRFALSPTGQTVGHSLNGSAHATDFRRPDHCKIVSRNVNGVQ